MSISTTDMTSRVKKTDRN